MRKYFEEIRKILALAFPVMLSSIAQTSMGAVDTIMAGSVGTADLAAVGIGTAIWMPTILLGDGLITVLMSFNSQFHGSGDYGKIKTYTRQGLWLAFIVSIMIMFPLYYSHNILKHFTHGDPLLLEKITSFIRVILWGTQGFLLFRVLRYQCDGLSNTKPGMIISFIGVAFNIPLNYIFIHGKFGMPELGGTGCAVATSAVQWIMFGLMWLYTRFSASQAKIRQAKASLLPKWNIIKSIVKLGMPIALAVFFESSLFEIVSILTAPFGKVAVASHQISLNFSSLIFMIPLSMGVATTVRIGYLQGEKHYDRAKLASKASLIIGFIITCFTASLTLWLRKDIAYLYNKDPNVIMLASELMTLAATYQFADAFQVIGGGILRGYRDTNSLFFITLISYWLVALPLGYYLSYKSHNVAFYGPKGFWVGFNVGLALSATLIVMRIQKVQKNFSR